MFKHTFAEKLYSNKRLSPYKKVKKRDPDPCSVEIELANGSLAIVKMSSFHRGI